MMTLNCFKSSRNEGNIPLTRDESQLLGEEIIQAIHNKQEARKVLSIFKKTERDKLFSDIQCVCCSIDAGHFQLLSLLCTNSSLNGTDVVFAKAGKLKLRKAVLKSALSRNDEAFQQQKEILYDDLAHSICSRLSDFDRISRDIERILYTIDQVLKWFGFMKTSIKKYVLPKLVTSSLLSSDHSLVIKLFAIIDHLFLHHKDYVAYFDKDGRSILDLAIVENPESPELISCLLNNGVPVSEYSLNLACEYQNKWKNGIKRNGRCCYPALFDMMTVLLNAGAQLNTSNCTQQHDNNAMLIIRFIVGRPISPHASKRCFLDFPLNCIYFTLVYEGEILATSKESDVDKYKADFMRLTNMLLALQTPQNPAYCLKSLLTICTFQLDDITSTMFCFLGI